MQKLFKIKEAILQAQKKYENLKNKFNLTDEQINIFSAVANATFIFNGDIEKFNFSESGRCIKSLRNDALKNLIEALKIDIELQDLKSIILAKSTYDILNEFCGYDNAYFFSDVYVGETDIYDLDTLRNRFIIFLDEENDFEFIYKLNDNFVYLCYYKINIEDFKKDYPNFKINN